MTIPEPTSGQQCTGAASAPAARCRTLTAVGLALLAFGLVLATIDDPGLTVDEPINVGHGKAFVTTLRANPLGLISDPMVVYRQWHNGHEHPPLARMLLGLGHSLFDPAPEDRRAFAPLAARPVSAAAYAFLVFLATQLGWRIAGPVAGVTSGAALLLMPRVFGHAHLASPEIISTTLHFSGLVSAAWALGPLQGQRLTRADVRRLSLAGVVLGLALLTKLTVVLLPLAVTIATLARLRWRGVMPLVLGGGVALAVFIAGWPWLWPFDFPGYAPGLAGTGQRLAEFLAVGVRRATIYVWYFDTQYPNATGGVPWHFVWVFFLVTVPVGLQLFGLLFGLPRALRMCQMSVATQLVLANVAVCLAFFTFPVERYDGERLFLLAFGPWAVVIGIGAAALADFVARCVGRRLAAAAVAVLLLAQSYGTIHYHPFQLSYYSLFVGGLRGATRLGLEATYWGDSLTEEVLDEFASAAGSGECAVLVPTLYAGHAVQLGSTKMRQKDLAVLPADLRKERACRWAIVFNRQGYLGDPEARQILASGAPIAQLECDGVWLSRVYRLPPP